jgi:hypothetical protein
MDVLSGDAKQLPESDVDYGHVSSVVSKTVEDEIKEEETFQPKPVTQTSSFYATAGASIAGVLALVLVNKGIIGAGQSYAATEVMSGAITIGLAWIVGKFVEARGKVSVAKVQAAQQTMALKMSMEYEQEKNKTVL